MQVEIELNTSTLWRNHMATLLVRAYCEQIYF